MMAMSTTRGTYGIRVQKRPNTCRNFEPYRHPTSNRPDQKVGKVRQVFQDDVQLTINDVRNILCLSQGTCRRIFIEELNMRRIAAKLVPVRRMITGNTAQFLCATIAPKRTDTSFLVLTLPKDENRVKRRKIQRYRYRRDSN
jgi:hypothetical protein